MLVCCLCVKYMKPCNYVFKTTSKKMFSSYFANFDYLSKLSASTAPVRLHDSRAKPPHCQKTLFAGLKPMTESEFMASSQHHLNFEIGRSFGVQCTNDMPFVQQNLTQKPTVFFSTFDTATFDTATFETKTN